MADKNKDILIGAHVSIAKGIVPALEEIKKYQGKVCQIFISNPRGRASKKRPVSELQEIKNYVTHNKITLAIHSPYVLNFAKKFQKSNWWLKTVVDELNYGEAMGAIGCVLHCGKYTDTDFKTGNTEMKKSVSHVLEQVTGKCKLLIETSCGQGTEMYYQIEELGKFFNSFSASEKKKMGLCLDTCHLFAAGYNLSDPKVCVEVWKKLKKLVGIEHIHLVHFNDSKKDVESHVDRHENIGKGKIDLMGLKTFANIAHKYRVPMVLETPGLGYTTEIKMVKKMITS